ncbi:helix-turn-helix domain-containing protein [Schaalia cardiffensis]
MDLYELLGEDPNSRDNRIARDLINEDARLIRDLVKARNAAHMTQADVAKAIGTTQASISRFESETSDLRQSTIRRYALAVGRIVRHRVEEYTPNIAVDSRGGTGAYDWESVGAHSRASILRTGMVRA